MLGVPHHEAPGEAEAECARLQQEGIVDAVWTDDSDAMMFGATHLIRSHYEGKKKSTTHIRLFQAQKIKETSGLDREGMVLFAMLSGGDYNMKGLAGCGPALSMEAAKAGLGISLCASDSPQALRFWREQLVEFFASKRKTIDVPMGFPCPKTLKKYTHPTVSTTQQIHDLRCLLNGWNGRALDEVKLRYFLTARFNIHAKGYIKHILPILLVKTLSLTERGQEKANNIYDVQPFVSKRKKTDADAPSLLRKVTFSAQRVTALDINTQLDGLEDVKDSSLLENKAGGSLELLARAECAILECILQKGVPYVLEEARNIAEAAATSSPTKKGGKGKQLAASDENTNAATKPSKRKAASQEVSLDFPKTAKKPKVNLKEKHTEVTQENVCSSLPSSSRALTEKVSPPKKSRRDFLVPPSLSLPPLPQQSHSTSMKRSFSPQNAVVNRSLKRDEQENLFPLQTSSRKPASAISYAQAGLSSPPSKPMSKDNSCHSPRSKQRDLSPLLDGVSKATAQSQEHNAASKLSCVGQSSWATHGFALLNDAALGSLDENALPAPAARSPLASTAQGGWSRLSSPTLLASNRPGMDVIDLTLD
jgi:Holliday junction resolvase YEN1